MFGSFPYDSVCESCLTIPRVILKVNDGKVKDRTSRLLNVRNKYIINNKNVLLKIYFSFNFIVIYMNIYNIEIYHNKIKKDMLF